MNTHSLGVVPRLAWPVAMIAGALALGWLIYTTGPTTKPEESVSHSKRVRTVVIQPGTSKIQIRAYGSVIPARKVTIEPQVTGKIIRHHEDMIPGGFIAEGEELFGIEPKLTELELNESLAALARANASLKEARRKWEEGRKLADEKVVSDTQLASLETNLQIQIAEVQRIKAGVAKTEELLKRHAVRTPFNAIVLDEFVEIGQRVDPGYLAATLVGTDEFWVQAVLPVDQLSWVQLPDTDHPGASANIYFDTGNGQREHFHGIVVLLLSDLAESGKMARLLVSIKDPMRLKSNPNGIPLLLGSFVHVEIEAGELENVLAIQRKAMRGGDRIWVVDAEDKLQIRDINVRWREDETVYIDNVLQPGESIIISELRVALPGMSVNPHPVNGLQAEAHDSADR